MIEVDPRTLLDKALEVLSNPQIPAETLRKMPPEALKALDDNDHGRLAELANQAQERHRHTRAELRNLLEQVAENPEATDADRLAAVRAMASYVQWENRPQPRLADDITGDRPRPILTARDQDGPLLQAGIVATLAGAGGTGKSTLALQTALQLAAASEEGDHSNDGLWTCATPGPVLYATYEDAPAITRERISGQARRLSCSDGLKRVYILDLAGYPLYGPTEGAHTAARPEPLQGWAVLQDAAKKYKPRLIVIDPALAAFVGESNAAAPVREFVGALSRLATDHEAAVLLVAHSTKAARGNRHSAPDPFDPGQISGSAAWHDAARACLVLTRNDGNWTLAVSKANYGPAYIKADLMQDDGYYTFRANIADGLTWIAQGDHQAASTTQNGKAEGVSTSV